MSLCAPGSGFRASVSGSLPPRSLLLATFGARHGGGGVGHQAGAPGVRQGSPSHPASRSSLTTGLCGVVRGGDRARTPGLPQPVPALGPCPSSKQRPARRRQEGVRATLNSLPALGAADLWGPSSPQLLSPGSAGRGPRARGGAVQTCWERFLGSDLRIAPGSSSN